MIVSNSAHDLHRTGAVPRVKGNGHDLHAAILEVSGVQVGWLTGNGKGGSDAMGMQCDGMGGATPICGNPAKRCHRVEKGEEKRAWDLWRIFQICMRVLWGGEFP